MELSDVKPFVQVPSWNDDSKFEVSGKDFRTLYELAMWLGPLLEGVQRAYMVNQQSGIVKVTYQYQDGSGEVPADVVKEYFETAQQKIKEYVADATAAKAEAVGVDPEVDVNEDNVQKAKADDPIKQSILNNNN